MRGPDWDVFTETICLAARLRMTVVMEHFCDHGEQDLPRGAFRWLSKSEGILDAVREGAFEAHGVVLRGRASDRVFFVASIEIDVATPPPNIRPTRPLNDPRQPSLPLAFTLGGKDDG